MTLRVTRGVLVVELRGLLVHDALHRDSLR
jgi:hypothetical protein